MSSTTLMESKQMPVWLVDNPYVLKWYRKPGLFLEQCLLSVLQWHNQTLNIWTHLAGLLMSFYQFFYAFPDHLSDPIDELFLRSAYFGIGACFFCSVIYHVFNCGSFESSRFLSQVDYCGIILHITGVMLALVYFTFYSYAPLRMAYVTLYVLLCIVCLGMNYHCMFSSVTNHMNSVQRSAFFIFVVAFSVPPQIYMGFRYSWSMFFHATFTDSLYLIGAAIYALKLPEKWWPGVFDLCNSHTIFHVFIWAAAYGSTYSLTMLSKLAIDKQYN